MLRLLDADPRSRMPGGASRLWMVVISVAIVAGTALPMAMSSNTAVSADSTTEAADAPSDTGEPLTPAEITDAAVAATATFKIPADSPALPPPALPPPPSLPSPHKPPAPPPSPETLLEKQKRLEKEAELLEELLEQQRQNLQQEHERQRHLTTALQVDLCSMSSTFNVAPFCPFAYNDSEPLVEVHDTAYEINLDIPGLRKEDLTVSVSNNALRSEWGNGASVSDGVGNVLQIIGRTANVNMDVGIARAVQFYNDADWDKGLNTTHSDGHLRIRVARRSSASRPMWSTWQIPGHLPESQLDRRFYNISERLKGAIIVNWQSVVLPAMQWFAQAPEEALAWWFKKYYYFNKQEQSQSGFRVTRKKILHPFDLINETEAAIYKISAAKEFCGRRANFRKYFSFTGTSNSYRNMLYCNDDWIQSLADFESAHVVEAIDDHLSKTIKNIEESGGYNIIVKTKILDGTMYKIDTNGVQYRQQTLPSFGNWWSKNVKITRQDGLDVIFIPIKTDET